MAYPKQSFGDYVKHTYRKHNQEADHMAKLGEERVSNVTVKTVKKDRDVYSDTGR